MANQVLLKGQYGKQNPLFMYQGTGGYSLIVALDLKAVVDANNAEIRLCGTLPEPATVGYTTQGTVSAAYSAEAFAVSSAESGSSYSGTLPD